MNMESENVKGATAFPDAYNAMFLILGHQPFLLKKKKFSSKKKKKRLYEPLIIWLSDNLSRLPAYVTCSQKALESSVGAQCMIRVPDTYCQKLPTFRKHSRTSAIFQKLVKD